MNPQHPCYAVIVAGGRGARMGTAVPKQFLEISGRPVLFYTIREFMQAIPDIRIILVLPARQLSYAQMVLQHFPDRIDITIVTGGETRFHSVQNGIRHTEPGSIIMVHDGVRPFPGAELIRRCYSQALSKGSAIPAIPVSDSIRSVNGTQSTPVDRESLRIIQTPQAFRHDILLPAFTLPYRDSFTDEASVAEAAGHTVNLVPGEKRNIKITTPEDLIIAESILANQTG